MGAIWRCISAVVLGNRRPAVLSALSVVLLAACSSGAAPSVPANASPSVPLTSEGLPSDAWTWEHVVLSSDDATVLRLAVGSNEVVALVAGPQPSLWSSSDGRAWQKQFTFDQDDYPMDVAATRSGFVVVGGHDDRTGSASSPVAWSSADGQTWERQAIGLTSLGLQYLATNADGVTVAMGACLLPKQAETELACGARLMEDGTWVPIDIEAAEGGLITAVRAGGPGFVAGGQLRAPNEAGQAILWTSTDGTSWQRATADGALPGSPVIYGLVAGADGWLVVGAVVDPQRGIVPLALRSADGKSWAVSDLPTAGSSEAISAGGMFYEAARALDGTLLVAGVEAFSDATGTQLGLLLAISTDGTTWTRVSEVASTRLMGDGSSDLGLRTVVAMSDRVIVGGALDGASVWIGTPPDD